MSADKTGESLCMVSAQDFARYFDGGTWTRIELTWSGIERRTAGERRADVHDRRWDKAKGRRYMPDRRKAKV